jgi:hypothetical protein
LRFADKLMGIILETLTAPTSDTAIDGELEAKREVVATKVSVFDLLHNLVVFRQKAKALISEPDLLVAILEAYNRLQDG